MCTPGTVCSPLPLHTPHPKVGPCMQFHIMLLSRCVLISNAWSVCTEIGMHVMCAGQVELDQEVCKQLLQTGHFQQMQLDVDEVFVVAAWLLQHIACYADSHHVLSAAPAQSAQPFQSHATVI